MTGTTIITTLAVLSLVPNTMAFGGSSTPFTSAWLREAEKKHGRVAILAVPALATISATNGGIDPVPWLNDQSSAAQLMFYASAGILESFNLRRFNANFALRDGEVPGQLWDVNVPAGVDHAEDFAGRFAMLAATAMFVSSVVTT